VELEALPLEVDLESLDKPAEYAAFGDETVGSDEVAEEEQRCRHESPPWERVR